MTTPKSPITHSSNTVLLKSVSTDYIIQGYKNYLSIDVARFFKSKELGIYKCEDTGFCFYYPDSLAGDGTFYKELQKIDWYYQDWKYEYDIAGNLISSGEKVLEIGCGKGAFLKFLKNKNIEAVGLELNDQVVETSKSSGIKIINETIENHALSNHERYDWVISFQVLEHIADVKSFIEASVNALRKGGKMIIAVPNNDALFFKHDQLLTQHVELQQRTLLMNMPPHHMGLWNEEVLKNIARVFTMKLDSIHKEPLPQFRAGMVSEIIAQKLTLPGSFKLREKLSKAIFKVVRRIKKYISGDTILAVYSKP